MLYYNIRQLGHAAALITGLLTHPAMAIEVGNPNISRDAAICRQLTQEFHQELAAQQPKSEGADDAKKTGERGAYLCRFERYREGIARLEQALAALRATR
jgi:hypothetical protein